MPQNSRDKDLPKGYKRNTILASKSHPGRVHDYNVFKQENTSKKLPRKSSHYVDCSYNGAPNDYPECTIIMPVKTRKSHRTLTLAQKRFNRKHSRIRILVSKRKQTFTNEF